MCTKFLADGMVHQYFNPYDSPYDSYINFMNVLDHLPPPAQRGRQARTPQGRRTAPVRLLHPRRPPKAPASRAARKVQKPLIRQISFKIP